MLRALCILIPAAVVLFHFIFEDVLLWLISLLFGILGFIFSLINVKFRSNAVAWGLLILNIGVFIFTIIYTIQNFT